MASGILLQFRRAPLHVLGNLLYSAFFAAWLVYRVLLGFSFIFLQGFFSKSVALAVSLRFIVYKGGLTVSARFLVSVWTRFCRSHRVGVCCCSFIARLAWLNLAQLTTVCRRV